MHLCTPFFIKLSSLFSSLSHHAIQFPLWDHFFFFFLRFYVFIFRDRGREEEREGEKHLLVASHTRRNWGLIPQPRHVPWPGIKAEAFRFVGQCPTKPRLPGFFYSLFRCSYYLGCSYVSLPFACFSFLPHPPLPHLFSFESLSFHSPKMTLFIPIASNITSEWMHFKSIPLTLNPCPRSFKSDYEPND